MPCSLSVLLARKAPRAVILRRGPSKLVRLILWHTDTDEVELGQWFRGRIYEGSCDLSLNGTLFIYLAAKWNRFTVKDREYTYAWTAISKPPWLTALALWPAVEYYEDSGEHSVLQGGGGFFIDDKTVWLNHKPELAKPHSQHRPKGLRIIAKPPEYGEIERQRTSRDGWVIVQEGKRHYGRSGWVVERPLILEKCNTKRPGTSLVTVTEYQTRFSARNDSTGETRELEGVDWADWDQRGRLVFTRGCALLAADELENVADAKLIGDFSSQTFASIVAPEWATHW